MPMNFRLMLNGDLPSDNFKPNNDVVFTLPLGGKITTGRVVIEGNLVLAGGANSGAAVFGDASPAHLIKEIIVRATAADGSRYFSGIVVDCSPRSLLRYGIAQRRKYMDDIGASNLGDGAAGNYAVYCAIPIFFSDQNVARQNITALNTDPFAYKTIQVIIRCGDITSVFAGNDRVADYSGLRLRWVEDRLDMMGDTFTLAQEDHVVQIPAAKKDFTDSSLEADGAYLTWFLMTEIGADHHLSEGVLLNLVELSSGSAIQINEFEPNDLKQKMYDENWWDTAQDSTGQYFVDVSNGNVFTPAPAPLKTKMNIAMLSGSNVDQLRVYTRRYFTPNRFQNTKPMEEYG